MEKPVVKIKNAEMRGGYLWGTVVDHPNFKENTRVQTSTILKQYEADDKKYVETQNTVYELI